MGLGCFQDGGGILLLAVKLLGILEGDTFRDGLGSARGHLN